MSATILTLLCCCLTVDEAALQTAETHRARGRYTEAVEAFTELATADPHHERVVLGRVNAHLAQGERGRAEELLAAGLKSLPESHRLWALRAQVDFERGRFDDATKAVQSALKLNPDQPQARLVQAHLWAETGQLKQASEGYRWFVRFYNRKQPTDAETLVLVAEGAAQYARWQSISQIFDFTVNTLCVDALKSDADCWQAHAIAGALLLEKYNRADAVPELQAALAINPNAVPVLLALASSALEQLRYDETRRHLDRALSVDANHPVALRLQAELEIAQGQLDAADSLLVRSLKIQPTNQHTLALNAFLHTLRGDQPSPERLQQLLAHLDHIDDWKPTDSPFEKLVVDLARRNPRPGYFLSELGRLFEQQRKFSLAERCYQQAIASMPQLSQPKTELGMLYFQTGRMPESQKLLDDAFKSDPYHLRVSNMRKVLKVLDGYTTVTTPHFVLRADSQLDGVLAKYMAEYLESIYPEITQQFGYEPPQRTQIEIYNKAKGQSGHQWFSARMVGLPWLQTIGASTGLIVAMTSPAATDEPFNWARVLRHEFVHIVTLQQTDFNIPRWLTEALATRAEGYPTPREWNRLLRERVARNELRNLDNLHLGFQRAESQEDWLFAYCQSVLYAEYFVQRFGADALPRLLNAYRDTRSTEQALHVAYNVKKDDVEAGYLVFLKERVAQLQARPGDEPRDPVAIRQAYTDRPNDPTAQADFAWLQLRQGQTEAAVKLAEGVLALEARQPVAATVAAQAKLQAGDINAAAKIAAAAYDPQFPHAGLWWLLGNLWLKQDKPAEALALFQRGRIAFSDDPRWLRGIAEAAAGASETALQTAALETLAATDPDDAGPRVALAQLAYGTGDFARAVKYAKLALHIDVLDAEVHLLLARGLRHQQQWPGAIDEYGIALQLKPGETTWDIEFAETLWSADRQDDARKRLDEILKRHPDHADAQTLREEWRKSP